MDESQFPHAPATPPNPRSAAATPAEILPPRRTGRQNSRMHTEILPAHKSHAPDESSRSRQIAVSSNRARKQLPPAAHPNSAPSRSFDYAPAALPHPVPFSNDPAPELTQRLPSLRMHRPRESSPAPAPHK